MITMAKKRKPGGGRRKGQEPPGRMIASFKGSNAFADWFERLVEFVRADLEVPNLPASYVIERGLRCYAKEKGFTEEAPRR